MFFDFNTNEVVEGKDGYKIFLDVPGVRKENITIETEGTELLISATRKARDGSQYPRTQDNGKLIRRFRFDPSAVSTEGAKAQLEDGVLEVFLPKTSKAKTHRIQIQ